MIRNAYLSILVAGALAALPTASLFAQEPAAAPTPSVSSPAGPAQPDQPQAGEPGRRAGRMREALAALTPEERQEIMAARQKAMSDPAVQAARADRRSDPKAFHKAMRQAMLKADPNVQPILKKMHAAMHNSKTQQPS